MNSESSTSRSTEAFAVVFDMDGVLIDSVGLNWQAINQALAPYKVAVSDEHIVRYLGKTLEDQVKLLNNDLRLNLSYDVFESTVNELKAALLTELRPKEGVEELLRALQAAQVSMAVATSMPRALTAQRLDTAGILTYFDALATADDATKHKPDPEVYQKASALLNIRPGRCVAFEDAPAGIASAKAAGMRCIAVNTPYTSSKDLQKADLIIPSMRFADLPAVRSLVVK